MNEEDEEELVEDHRKELSFEEPKELHNEEAEAMKQRIAYRNEDDKDKGKSHSIPAEDLKEVFSCQNKLSKIMKHYHPHTAAVEMGLNLDGPLLEGPKIQDKAVKPGFILQKGGQTPSN